MQTIVAAPVQPNQDGGVDTGTIVVGGIAVFILVVIAYMVFGPKSTIAAPKAGATTAKPIPGVKAGGTSNLGFLTDPNFFSGVNNLANTLSKAFGGSSSKPGGGGSSAPGDNSLLSSPGDDSTAALAGADIYPQPENSEPSDPFPYSPLLSSN